MAADEPDQDPIEEDARISSLEERLKKAQDGDRVRNKRGDASDKHNRLGGRVLSELIGGVAGGFIVGFFLDRWLGTAPWFLLFFLFGGMFVAFRNIYRIANQATKDVPLGDTLEDDQGLD